jgi:Zn-dependent metalloprotease
MDEAAPAAEGAAPAMEEVRIFDKAASRVVGDVSKAALDYVRNYDAELGLTELDELVVRSVSDSKRGVHMQHVRLNHLHEGLPVWGSDVVVHTSNDEFVGISGALAKRLPQLDVLPALDAAEALAIGKGEYGTRNKLRARLDYSREKSELVVFPGEKGAPRVAWHVVFFTELQAGITPGLWNYFIDAKSGEILFQFNGIHTLSQASGPGGNPKVARTWTNALDVEPSGAQFQMNTARLRTSNMNNSTSGNGTIVVGPLNPIGDAPINDAHGFAEVTLNTLQDWYGHNSINDAGFLIRSRVHYGNNYENAFWDGAQMTYGDGASTFYPLPGDVDVVAHEINHGFTTFHSNLTYSGQSGGNNESFSDIAGTIAEHFSEGDAADWDLGRDIFRGNDALRFMCNPPQDGNSIDHVDDYFNGLDVHYSSGIMNKAFCLASGGINATAVNVRRMGEAWYRANDDFWTTSSNFVQACEGIIDAATALGFSAAEITAIDQAWQQVGVSCNGGPPPPPTCDETITTASGTITSPNFPNNYPNNFARTICIDPPGDTAATLTFSAFNTEANYDFVTITNAAGEQLSRTSGTTAPAAATSTFLSVRFTSDQSVVRTGWSASWGGGGGGTWSGSATPNLPTVDNGSACTNLTVTGTGNASEARLNISGRHDYRSILRGTLQHNGATVAAFPIRTFPNGSGNFSFTNRAVPGLSGSASGAWTLCIVDTDGFGDTGVLNTWSVHN